MTNSSMFLTKWRVFVFFFCLLTPAGDDIESDVDDGEDLLRLVRSGEQSPPTWGYLTGLRLRF